ncbi:MAG: cupin domain-containing protein [Candidatus Krumholzibacteria bacterium]|jgi:predicted cupin superfamily sugar epimerase|nr:cupin domain-containing protein [Candidatus Krumholzibacteria bacterium]
MPLPEAARRLCDAHALMPHPEGGWFRETWRAGLTVPTPWGERPAGTSILYLLTGGQVSRPHRLRQDEIWLFQAGTGLLLHLFAPQGRHVVHRLGPEHTLQVAVPAGVWMGAETDGGWGLVGCACAPGFEFDDLTFAARADLLADWPAAAATIERLLS